MDENRKFKVGDLVDAKELDYGVLRQQITDGVIVEVVGPDDRAFSRGDAYYVVHACDPRMVGGFFKEEDVKLRSADDAWRAGHLFLGDWVVADDGITSFEGVIEKFVADGDRPYKVHDGATKQTGFFGEAHLTIKYRNRNNRGERFQIGDWVVADDGNVRLEDAVIGREPVSHFFSEGQRSAGHFVYAADGSGDVRQYREEHLRPRTYPVYPEFRDPEGIIPDYRWVYDAPERARRKAFQESRRQSAEVEVLPKDSSLYKRLNPEPRKRPIVSGFRGVLMWIAAIPVATLTAESLDPGAGQVVSLILVVSSAVVVPWIASRLNP